MQSEKFLEDLLFSLPYILVLLLIGLAIKSKYQKKNIEYKYFFTGLLVKLLGVFLFALIYIFYYQGGDTLSYFIGSEALGNLLLHDFEKGFAILFNTDSPHNHFNSFNLITGYPPTYMFYGEETFNVCRYTTVFSLIGFNSFFATSFLLSFCSYVGLWKFYQLLTKLYPELQKQLSFFVLFIPSLFFWGSGIMKDTYVLCSVCWITYNFHMFFIERKKLMINGILLAFNLFIIINIKSYVIISLIPGMLLWLNYSYLRSIKSVLLKLLFLPVLFTVITILGIYIFQNLSSLMGVYGDMDSAIQQAQIIQADLLREDQYGSNNYDIGEIDGSITNLLSISPLAIFTALYRPLFWEIGSPTMVFSAIENTLFLILTFYVLLRTNPLKTFRIIYKDPFLIYCFIFSLLFAFGVGIAGTNFGALVRYKIPLIPFYFPMLYIVYKLGVKRS